MFAARELSQLRAPLKTTTQPVCYRNVEDADAYFDSVGESPDNGDASYEPNRLLISSAQQDTLSFHPLEVQDPNGRMSTGTLNMSNFRIRCSGGRPPPPQWRTSSEDRGGLLEDSGVDSPSLVDDAKLLPERKKHDFFHCSSSSMGTRYQNVRGGTTSATKGRLDNKHIGSCREGGSFSSVSSFGSSHGSGHHEMRFEKTNGIGVSTS